MKKIGNLNWPDKLSPESNDVKNEKKLLSKKN